LVATEFAPNASGGGPVIVRQMLSGWPQEKLFWWNCLTDRDAPFDQPLAAHRVAHIPKRLYPHRRYRSIKSSLLKNVWAPLAALHLRTTISRLKPDVIWAIPHGWSIPPLGRALLGNEIPFHVSIHDFADINSCVFRFGLRRARRMAAITDALYSTATTRDAISEPMLVDLHSRTGHNGALVRAGLEPSDFSYLADKASSPTAEIRIAYAGTIIVEETFACFVEALQRVRPQLAKRISLEFFSAHSYRARPWFDPSCMQEHGLYSEAELSHALKDFAWGFAPMSLDDNDPRYNRFSLPTKFVSYLAAGLPIITLGHPESSLIKLARAYDIGPCVASAKPAAIDQELLRALSNENPWAVFRSEVQRCAHAEFDAERMRKTLWESFSASTGQVAT